MNMTRLPCCLLYVLLAKVSSEFFVEKQMVLPTREMSLSLLREISLLENIPLNINKSSSSPVLCTCTLTFESKLILFSHSQQGMVRWECLLILIPFEPPLLIGQSDFTCVMRTAAARRRWSLHWSVISQPQLHPFRDVEFSVD